MKKLLFALLTTIFATVMPLQAAFAEGATCRLTYAVAVREQIRATVEEQHGSIVELSGDRAKAFADSFAELMQQPHPPVDQVAIVVPSDEENAPANIGFFQAGCMIGFSKLPKEVAFKLVPPVGEKVD